MAVLEQNSLTLLDLAKRTDPDGTIGTIAEVLKQQNEILDDMTFLNGNLTTGHMTTVRTGIPTPTWTKISQRINPQKSKTAQITFNTGKMETVSEVPSDLATLSGDPREVLFTEELAFLQGINHELARTIFFGNEDSEPAEFTGLAPYYNDKGAESGSNIIDANGTGSDNASIYLVGWSPTTIHGIVPKNSTAGLERQFLGEETSEDNGLMRVFRTWFKLYAGLAVRDWRYCVRIANIDRSELTPDASGSSANLPDLMFSAMEQIHSLDGVTPVFYMDRTIRETLRKQLSNAVSGSTLTFEDVGGRRTAMFQEVPIRRVDQLKVDEARVV